MMQFILASKSPRRVQLLGELGYKFEVVPSLSEAPVTRTLPPEEAVRKIALSKAEEVAGRAAPGELILAADTLVYLDSRPLGKPKDAADARRMLGALSGREHLVVTGIALIRGDTVLTEAESTLVRFRRMSNEEIEWYIATGEPLDKAGAYGVQGRGAAFIEGITGDWSNVVGLPVCRTVLALRKLGIELPEGQK